MAVILTRALSLVRASRYASPGDAAAILPEVYGGFSSGGLRGPVPAVLIDNVNWVYAAAAHAVGSITNVYVDNVEQTSGFTVNINNNYESQGAIATIDFTSQPAGEVTWRGTGKQSGGSTITNCVTQLEDLLVTRGGFSSSDFDTTTLELARAAVSSQGYETAWVVWDERFVVEWINEMMFNCMGGWWMTGAGTLGLFVDAGAAPTSSMLVAHIVARRDCVGGDDGVAMSGDFEHLVNALNVDYLWSWFTGNPSSRLTSPEHTLSKNAHGEVRKTVALRGHRRSVDVTAWSTVLFVRQAFTTRVEGAIISFTVDGPKLAHATIGDWIGFSWEWGPTREQGNSYRNEILRLVAIRHYLEELKFRTTVEAVDSGSYLTSGGSRDLSVYA